MSALLAATGIARSYHTRGLFGRTAPVRAVDGVSLAVGRGETLGIVGESGSGKSTTGRLLLGLEPADEGRVSFAGEPLPAAGTAAWRRSRARMQMIFQDPLGALDRRLPVAGQVREPLDIHRIGDSRERDDRVGFLLGSVGLTRDQASRYPHELSGGQRQRVVIARALATKPDLLVCDEPVSALDVSIQAQVSNLLIDLQASSASPVLFISHDLRVVRQVSRRVRSCISGASSRRAMPTIFSPILRIPTPARSSRPRRCRGGAGRRASCSRATAQSGRARPTAAPFIHAVRSPSRAGRAETPALADLGGGRRAACHLAAPAGGAAAGSLQEAS
jgi:peptide/nickel transport system ATP-binding protein